MEVNLRKAAALQNVINDTVRNIQIQSNVTITEFENPEVAVNEAVARFQATVTRQGALVAALYEIRQLVGAANASAGVDRILTQVAELDRVREFYDDLGANQPRIEPKVLAGRLDKIRNRKDDSDNIYGRRSDEVATSIFTEADINGFKKKAADAKRMKQELQDRLLDLNVTTKIKLPDSVQEVLKREGLL